MAERAKETPMDWQDIDTIPEHMLDGRQVWVKRMSPSRPDSIVSEGWAVFDVCNDLAPQRQPLGMDPLNRLSAADYAREDAFRVGHAEARKWLKPDRMYSFPTPTHWSPSKSASMTTPARDEGRG